MNRALLTDKEAAELYGISVRKFHELRANEPWMPAPVTLGPRCLRWSRDELLGAISEMRRQRLPAAEPAQLLKGRKERAAKAGATVVR